MSLEIQLAGVPTAASLLAHGRDEVQTALVARARAEGELAGRRAALEILDGAVAEVQAFEERTRNELARVACDLALEIARRILRRELAAGAYDIERIVRETLAEAAVGRSACVVHLNPADHARLADTRFRGGTRLEPDEGVPRGDVHVETALGLMVRDMESSLEAIDKRLKEELA